MAFTDIKDLLDKTDNEEAREEIESSDVSEDEYLSADEFVDKIVKPIIELQDDAKTNVKAVKFNNVTYSPDSNGLVTFNQSMDNDTYAVRLETDKSVTNQYVIKKDAILDVNIRYMAVKITTAGDRLNYRDVPGTLTIERSADGMEYGDVLYTQTVTSVAESSTDYPISVDLGKYVNTGMNHIRITVKSSYKDENDVEHTFKNTIVFTVNSVNLSVKNLVDFKKRILASVGGFPFSFAIMGAVKKYLHLKVSGSNGTWIPDAMEFSADEQRPESNPYSWTQNEIASYGILSHGVHTVEAWLSCDNGLGGTLESDHVINSFMVVNTDNAGANLYKKFIMLQGVQSAVTNYVRTLISQFAVWIPDSTDATVASASSEDISVRITDAGDGDTGYTTEYYRTELKCVSGTTYDIDTTIEIENTTDGAAPKTYQAYLRIFNYNNGAVNNIMYDSSKSRFKVFTVDNSNDYSPVAGSHFYLNPRVRNNSETNWNTIINQQTKKTVPSTWTGIGNTNEGWTTDNDGIKVLRVLAKHRLNIGYEPFEDFLTSKTEAMTIEMEFAVRNITAEDEPIIDISQYIEKDNERLGIRLLPLTGALWAKENQMENDQDFGYEEDNRVHLVITFNPAMIARSSDEFTWQTPNGTEANRPTAKVYINGKHKRAVQYSVEKSGVWVQGEGHGGITIGNDNADVDIYFMRVYRGNALSAQNVLQNYIASRPTAEEKNYIREENDILDGNGRVGIKKVQKKGKRTLTWVGTDNYKINQDTVTGYAGYWDIYFCDDNGNYKPELSGTICKAAYLAYVNDKLENKKCLMQTAQGSTANTYWWNNGQTKCDAVTFVINIPFSTLHSDFGWKASKSTPDADGKCDNPMYLNGEQITPTEYNALQDSQKELVTIDVLDGWIDGNGMYHGQFYTSYVGGAKSTKLVNKINYASPQQSHKMGATRLYNDVMMAVTDGGMALHKTDNKARFAVYEDSFYYFNQPVGQSSPVFVGIGTFGQGKADKPAWGYDKKVHVNMAMFEGANNNLPLTDFIVPFDDDVVYRAYVDGEKKESYYYNGDKSLDFSLGNTTTFTEDGKSQKRPTVAIENILKRYVNFIYTHDIRIELYRGTRSLFDSYYATVYAAGTAEYATEEDTKALEEMQKTKYWMRDGSSQFQLIRFNFVTGQWVDAGTWNQTTMSYTAGVRDLSTDSMTAEAYQRWLDSDGNGDYVALNTYFKNAIGKHFNDYFGTVGHIVNHKTHYNFVNHLLAGTDNCSKNTYYVIDPETGLMWLYQDDLDTIFKTDNNGRQTKVYFLSRFFDKYDYEHGYKSQTDYEGSHNALFNSIEYAWETMDNTALAANMRSILTAMSSLVKSTDNLPGLSDSQKQTPWGCINKYFFSIQNYFPANAYNEQQRIRYDFPASFLFISYGNQARGIEAVTQGIGDQLESERQYMKRRLALVCSYAAWGDFSAGVNTGSVGLDDTSSAFSITPGSGRVGGEYTFKVKPHQFIYPCGSRDRSLVNPHVRVAPGEEYSLTLATAGNSISGDSSVGLAAIHYYRSIGNVGNMVAGNNTIKVEGKRLTEFTAEPSSGSTAFSPGQISVTAPNISKFSLKGLSTVSGTVTLTSQIRMEDIDLRGTQFATVNLPETNTLESVRLGSNVNAVSIANMPNLETLTFDGFSNLSCLVIDDAPKLNTKYIATQAYVTNAPVTTLSMTGVSWGTAGTEQGITALVMQWILSRTNVTLTGYVNINDNVSAEMKVNLLRKLGAVDNSSNPLYITYQSRAVTGITVDGAVRIRKAGTYQYNTVFAPLTANNFKSLKYSISENSYATINEDTGLLTATEPPLESVEKPEATVTATVTNLDNTTVTSSMKVYLYNRIPKVGDFAYADGDFDEILHTSKTVVGWVYKVTKYADLPDYVLNEYMKDTDTKSKYEAGQQLYEVLVQSKSDISYKTSDGATTFSITPWGIYNNDATNGLTSDEIDAVAAATGIDKKNVTNLANLNNYNTTGLRNSAGTSYSDNYINDYNAYDDTTDDGFMQYSDSYAVGRWDGKASTDVIVQHAEKMLNDYVGNGTMVGSDGKTIWYYISADHVVPENLTELADLLIALDKLGGANRWHALAYPAAMSCHLFEPAVTGTLHDGFKRGNWYLPSAGDWTRIYIYFRNSRANTPQDSDTPTASYNDIDNASRAREITEARRPWFANMLRRAQMAGNECPIAMLTQSNSWCSTEYSSGSAWSVSPGDGYVYNRYKYASFVVRPVAAFCFIL